jgi:phosphodiesterase/alkaline phosphatase D-like protein
VEATIEGLEDFTEYHYRITASNGYGKSYGPILSFKSTPPTPPTISDASAHDVTGTGAVLSATVVPNYGEVLYGFEYGETQAYGSQIIAGDLLPADGTGHPVQMEIAGLTPGQTYHYRAIAINFGGISYGQDRTLSTLDVPQVLLAGASAISSSGARLEATINPSSSPTSVHFEYGTDTSYGRSTAGVPVGGGSSAVSAGVDVSGLSAATTYHFRAVASNAVGTVDGPDQVFTTAPGVAVTEPPACGRGFVRRGDDCVRRHRGKRCKHGLVKRHGKCLKRKQRKRHRRAANGKRHGAK